MEILKPYLDKAFSMSKHERTTRVCVLAAKETMGTADIQESYELAAIQVVRELKGELPLRDAIYESNNP